MMSQTQDRKNLEAIAGLVAHCRDSARSLRLDALTYYLDMTFVAACSDLDHPRAEVDIRALRQMIDIPGNDIGEPWLLDLNTIQTAIQGCLNWARDLERGTLVYLLKIALVACSMASTDRG